MSDKAEDKKDAQDIAEHARSAATQEMDRLKKMSLENLAVELENKVYKEAAYLYEHAEHRGLIHGNGHHMAQQIAGAAKDLMLVRSNAKKTT